MRFHYHVGRKLRLQIAPEGDLITESSFLNGSQFWSNLIKVGDGES